jgi:hypothetical protein
MNCISDELIQKYVDGEVKQGETVLIEQHLFGCKSCTDRLYQQRKLSEELKLAICSIVDDNIDIPLFDPQKNRIEKPKFRSTKTILLIPAFIVAASLVLFFMVYRNANDTQKVDRIPFASTCNYEFDANQPLSGQPIIIHTTDPEGNQNDYLIE